MIQSLLNSANAWLGLMDRFVYSSSHRTSSAPHVRDATSVQGMLNQLVVATLPCWLIGLWNLGHQMNLAMAQMSSPALAGWRGQLVGVLGLGHEPDVVSDCLFLGLVYFLPIFLVALLVVSIWEALFSAIRQRPPGEGLLVFAWLLSLMLPAGIALYQVALGATFGYVVGSAIFGGSGRYLVNPVVLAIVFLQFAYPGLGVDPQNWVPVAGDLTPAPLVLAATGGVDGVIQSGYRWVDLLFGNRPGAIGTVSVLGCLIGGVYLLLTDTISWRIVIGTLVGFAGSVTLFNALAVPPSPIAAVPLSWHLVLGGAAFGAIFLATDPVPAATTQTGRWVYGMLVGALTIVIRVGNPSYTEGILFAILLASLFSPVVDFVVIEANMKRRRRRLPEVQSE